ncbi:MAG: hypothetical protein J6W86_08965 [Bacteroidales bacterium]|nr:hypothetical protein [Bacteroidales bacterium]
MKKYLLILLLFLCIQTNAQTSVCGIPFGTSYERTEQMLNNKFGPSVYNSHESIIYQSILYAGFEWDFLWFGFQRNNSGNSYFSGAIFSKNFNSYKDATNYYSKVKSAFAKSYDIITDEYTGEGENAIYCYAARSADIDYKTSVGLYVKRKPSEYHIYTYTVEVIYCGPDYVTESL